MKRNAQPTYPRREAVERILALEESKNTSVFSAWDVRLGKLIEVTTLGDVDGHFARHELVISLSKRGMSFNKIGELLGVSGSAARELARRVVRRRPEADKPVDAPRGRRHFIAQIKTKGDLFRAIAAAGIQREDWLCLVNTQEKLIKSELLEPSSGEMFVKPLAKSSHEPGRPSLPGQKRATRQR